MKAYVLDTSFFFNLEIKSGFGESPKAIMICLADYAEKLAKSKAATFYLPPSIVEEFLTFIDDERAQHVQKFLASVSIKAPDMSQLSVSATVLQDMVEDVRRRSYRGLQIAEEEMEHAVEAMALKESTPLSKKDMQIRLGTHIRTLRDRYRNATRTKFLDSVSDLDVILLAKECDGAVVTADEGLLLWGRKMGVREVVPHVFHLELDALLRA